MTGNNSNAKWDMHTLLKLVEKADYILLHFTDILGFLRGRTVPVEQAETILNEGVGFDGSSIIGGMNIEESDMIMKPDISSFTVCPYYFYEKSAVSFICDILTPEGKPLEKDPRYICQKNVDNALKKGYMVTAAAEIEFYLAQRDEAGEIQPVENHLMEKQRYFDMAPDRNTTESYRMELSSALSTMGMTVERQHHEAGAAQNEITFKYADPKTTSDNVMRYKFAAKAIANKKYGWIATFMPKPWVNRAGSGMHIHMGLFDQKTSRNLFYDQQNYTCISQDCRYFIGGLLEHARAICAIVAPTINSYKRLVPGFEAPVYIAWSKRNRSALIRVPEYFPNKEEEARIEFRCPDPLCNPYLAHAVILEAGLDGIRKKIDPGDPLDVNIYHLNEAKRREFGLKALPTTLEEALEEWKSDEICIRILGRSNAETFVEIKMQECREYKEHAPNAKNEVTSWEIQKYLYA